MFSKKFLAMTAILSGTVSAQAVEITSPSENPSYNDSHHELQKEDLRSPNRGSSPRSFSNRALRLTHNQVSEENKGNAVGNKTSSCGHHWFHNVYATAEFGYSDFEDTQADNAGQIHYQGLTLGALFGESTDVSLTLSRDEQDQRGITDFRATTWGATLTANHHINDWLSVGGFLFYSETEFDGFSENNDTYGGGLFVSGYWMLTEGLDFSTVHSLSAAQDDFSNDSLYVGTARLGYDWCNEFNTGASVSYIDSLRDLAGFDSTYWTFGFDATWTVNERFSVGLSWETTEAKDHFHQQDTFLNLNYAF